MNRLLLLFATVFLSIVSYSQVIDEFNGSSIGNEYGVNFTTKDGRQTGEFRRANKSRVQYGLTSQIPTSGTLEWWVYIETGYQYWDYTLSMKPTQALLFTTDVWGGDVTWPGSTWLWVHSNGTVTWSMATSKYGKTPGQSISASNTSFRFNEWHKIGISYGTGGQHIMVDGQIVASNPANTQILGAGGNHSAPVDKPTIGEAVPGLWAAGRYTGGFEGYVDRFRISSASQDWVLALASETVEVDQEILSPGESTYLSVLNSIGGVEYSLIDKSTGLQIGTSQTGTGNTIVFETGTISANAEYQIQSNDGTKTELLDTTIAVAYSSLVCPSDIGAEQPNENRIAYWSFDNGKGTDDSGNGHTATVVGTIALPGKEGNGLIFDGSNDYLAINSIASKIKQPFSVSAWFKYPGSTTSSTIVGCNTSAGGNTFLLYIVNNQMCVHETSGITIYGPYVDDDAWHHVTYSSDGTKGELYVDGISYGTSTNTYTLTTTDKWSIGQEWDNTSNSDFFGGMIDEVSFYDKALTKEEVRSYLESKPVVTYDTEVCPAESGTVTIDQSESGVTYSLVKKGSSIAESTALGNDGQITLSTGNLSSTTEFDLKATLSGCTITLSESITVTVGSCCPMQASKGNIEDGILGYWSFDDGTATDNSGNLHDGTITGAVSVDGYKGKAMRFNNDPSTVEFIDVGRSLNTESFSIASYINYGNDGTHQIIASKLSVASAQTYKNFEFRVQPTGELFLHVPDGTTWSDVRSTVKVPTGEWVHVACTYDGTTAKIYMQGELVAEKVMATYVHTDINVVLGNRYSTASEGFEFNGMLDEVYLFRNALTQAEIQALASDAPRMSVAEAEVCSGGSTTINLEESELGVEYTLFNNATGAMIGSTQIGDGGALTFNTGAITATSTFDIKAENQYCFIPMDSVLTVTVGTCCPQNMATDLFTDLVGYYTFDGDALDQSGNGNDGTAFGSPIIGNELNIPKTIDNGVELPASVLAGATDFTISFTTSIADISGLTTWISGRSVDADNQFNLTYFESHKFEFFMNGSGQILVPYTLHENTTYHITYLREGSEMRLYVNDELVTKMQFATDPINISPGGLFVGQEQDALGGGFDATQALGGTMDNLYIYRRALSFDEIKELTGTQISVLAPDPICPGESAIITLLNSEQDVEYTLYDHSTGAAVGAIQLGNGGTLEFVLDNVLVTAQYDIMIKNDYCTVALSEPVTVSADACCPLDINEFGEAISINTNLIGHWKFDGDANDASGNLNHGAVYSAVQTEGYKGMAYAFDGTNDYIDLGSNADFARSNNLTVCAWVKSTSTAGTQRVFTTLRSTSERGFGFGQSAGKIRFTTYAVKDYETAPVLQTDEWTHIAAVFDSNNDVSFYVNGDLFEKVEGTAPAVSNSAYAMIGRSRYGSEEIWNGLLDEVRYYNRALDASEIKAIVGESIDMYFPQVACENSSIIVTLENSELDVEYSLVNKATGTQIGAARTGNGDTLQFSTGDIVTDSDFTIKAENQYCSKTLDTTIHIITKSCCPAGLYDSTQVLTGLGGSWNFDLGIGYDNSGNENYGSINGPQLVDGKKGKALSFDGVDDIFATNRTAFASNFTMECWFEATATHEIDAVASSGVDGAYNQRYLVFPQHGDRISIGSAGAGLSVGTNGISVYEHAGSYLPARLVYTGTLTGWNHLALVYTNNVPSLYVNGTLVRKGTASAYTVYASNALIGGGGYGYFQGKIDEYNVYGRALSANEIQSIVGFRPLTVSAEAEKCEGANATISIHNSESGTMYQLTDESGTAIGDPVTGTGNEIILESGELTGSSTFKITATNNHCSVELDTTITVSSVVCCATDVGQPVSFSSINDGLVAYYKFDGSDASDFSGNSNNGVISGAEVNKGVFGTGLLFDGVDDVVRVPNNVSLQFGEEISVSVWLKIDNWPSDGKEHYFLSKHTGWGNGQVGFHLYASNYNGNKLMYRHTNGSSAVCPVAFGEFPLNEYFHLSYVVNSDSVRAFINGRQVSSYPGSKTTIGNNTEDLLIGDGKWISSSMPYQGGIDEVRLYNRSLTQTEINVLATISPSIGKISPSICSGESAQIDITMSEEDVTYTLIDNTTGYPTGAPQKGNGGTISLTSDVLSADTDLSIEASLGSCDVMLDTVLSVQIGANGVADLNEDLAGLNLGDLDISGTAITVEAIVNYSGNELENIISKHTGHPDVNYLLRPTLFSITTGGVFTKVDNPISLEAGKTYHIAGTYDGSVVKFYVNGCEVNAVSATGSIVNNNLDAVIGCRPDNYASERLKGFVDEVRIWNIARSANQILNNIQGLADPVNETGLLAAYSFNCADPYKNLAGNAQFDATPIGDVFIREENTDVITGGCCAAALPEAIKLDEGLVGYWNFQDGEAVDLTTNGNDGVVAGATKVAGQNQDALSFDGVSDMVYVSNSTSLQFGAEQTISMWMKVDKFPTDGLEHYFLNKHTGWNNGQVGFHMYLSDYDDQNAIIYRNKNGYTPPWGICEVPFSAISEGEYFHLTYTITGTAINAYVNGKLISTAVGSGNDIGNNTEDLWFGWGKWTSESQHFNGELDEIRIYNRDLSEAEVQALFLKDHNIFASTDILCDDNHGADVTIEKSMSGVSYSLYQKGNSEPLATHTGDGSDIVLGTGTLSETTEFELIANNGECSIPFMEDITVEVGNCCPMNVDEFAEVSSINDELVAYWSFDDGTATDVSGNSHNGTIYGATPVSGIEGGAMSFDGVNDYLSCGNTAGNFGTDDFTVAYWTRTSDVRKLFSKRSICGHTNFFELDTHTFEIDDNGSDYYLGTIEKNIFDNVWHHIVLTRTGKTLQFYVDGVPDKSYTYSSVTNLDNTTALKIGTSVCVGKNGTESFKGQLDEIRFYTRSITQEEIRVLAKVSPQLTINNTTICENETTTISVENSEAGVSYKVVNKDSEALLSEVATGNGATLSIETNPLTESVDLKVIASTPVCDVDLTTEFSVTVGGKSCLPAGIGDTITPKDLNKGLIAYWSFDDGSATDNSGNGHDGTKNGGFFFDGLKGKAYLMDGSSDHITVPDAEALRLSGTDFSISSWVYMTEHDASWNSAIIGKRGTGSQNGYLIGIDGNEGTTAGHMSMAFSGGTDPNLKSTTAIDLDNWHHMVTTYDVSEQTMTMYIDGQYAGQNTAMPTPNANTSIDLRIGANTSSEHYFFGGMIDELRMYNKVLTETEIQSLHFEVLDVLVENEVPCSPSKPIVKIINSEFGVEYSLFNKATDAQIGDAQIGNTDTLTFLTETLVEATEIGIKATNNSVTVELDKTVTFAPGSIVTSIDSTICFGETAYFEGAEQSASGVYTDTYPSASGCDSIVTTSLTVLPEIKTTETVTICHGQSVYLEGADQTVAGDYTDVYTSTSGCDSVVVTTLIVNPAYTETDEVTICASELPFTFGAQTLSVAGEYTETFTAVDGCDSTVTLTLNVNPVYTETTEVTVCESDLPYVFGTQSLTVGGDFTEVFTSENGCDSTVTLTLHVNPIYSVTIEEIICESELPYTFGTQTLTTAGDYTEIFTSVSGCDSSVTVTLYVNPVYSETDEVTICSAELPYTFGTQSLTDAGEYTEVFTAVSGCDSTVTLTLNVNPLYSETVEVSICESQLPYVFGTQVLNATGDYSEIFVSEFGCDSTVQLALTVTPEYNEVMRDTICEGDTYTFGTQDLTLAGEYIELFQTEASCDSSVTLQLKVNPVYEISFEASICTGGTFTLGTQSLDSEGEYTELLQTEHGCDSTVTVQLSVTDKYELPVNAHICEGETYSFAGNDLSVADTYSETFVSQAGCDSVVTLELEVSPVFNEVAEFAICQDEQFVFGAQTLSVGGDYFEVFTSVAGCDSTVNLTLTVNDIYSETVENTLCESELPLTLGTQELTEGGVFVEHFASEFGCDSVVTLELTVNPVYDESSDLIVNFGATYQFGDTLLASSGEYSRLFTSEAGCDSLVSLNFTVLDPESVVTELTETACIAYEFAGEERTESGIYRDSLKTIHGADSVIVLDLTITQMEETYSLDTICEDVSQVDSIINIRHDISSCSASIEKIIVAPIYNVFETEYLCVHYTDTVRYYPTDIEYNISTYGCDSVVTTEAAYLNAYTEYDTAVICQGNDYRGETLSGDYTFPGTTVDLCDSSVYLNLTVNPVYAIATELEVEFEETYSFGDTLLATSGTYVQMLSSLEGCDSVVTLAFTVLDEGVTITNLVDEVCDSYIYNGVEYVESQTIRDTLESSMGYDSIVIIDVTIHPEFSIEDEATVAYGESYKFGTQLLEVSGDYTETFQSVTGCDSTVTLSFTVLPPENKLVELSDTVCELIVFAGIERTESGVYTDSLKTYQGADSVVVLDLTVGTPVELVEDTAICANTDYHGFTQEGEHTRILETQLGCDSTVITSLTVLPVFATGEVATIYNGTAYKGYSKTGTYDILYTASNGCDSTHTLELTVDSFFEIYEHISICEGSDYEGFTSSGTHTRTLQTSAGVDSVVYTVLSVHAVDTVYEDVTICEGDVYLDWTKTGQYQRHLFASTGCDSIVITNLTVNNSYDETEKLTICEGSTYKGFSEAGVYTMEGTTVSGCDSIVTIDLSVDTYFNVYEHITICEGSSFKDYTESGEYTETVMSSIGCDSIINTILTVTPIDSVTETVSICEGTEYEGHSETGQYINIVSSTLTGCDSVITIDLTVNPVYTITEDIEVCEGGTYQSWDTSGQYSRLFTTIHGCDSTLITNLIVLPKIEVYTEIVICEGENYNGNSIPGKYVDTLESELGCDSIVHIDLKIAQPYLTRIDTVFNEGNSIMLNGFKRSEVGTYFDTLRSMYGCDSVVVTLLSMNKKPWLMAQIEPQLADENGEFSDLPLHSYVNDDDGEQSNISWTVSDSENFHIIIVDGVAKVTPLDENWNGTEIIVYKATDAGGAILEIEVRYTIGSGTSVVESELHIHLELSPQPVSGKCVVTLQTNKVDKYDILILTSEGKLVERLYFGFGSGTLTRELDVSDLPVGMYYVKVLSPYQQVVTPLIKE